MEKESDSGSEVKVTGPKQHIVFQSSASESGNEAPSLQQVTTDKAVAGPSEVTMHLPAAKVRVHLYEKVRSSH